MNRNLIANYVTNYANHYGRKKKPSLKLGDAIKSLISTVMIKFKDKKNLFSFWILLYQELSFLSGLYYVSLKKIGSLLYKQETDCQCPAACLWWYLIGGPAGSRYYASLLVFMHDWHGHPQQQQWQPLTTPLLPTSY